MNFNTFGLESSILSALQQKNYQTPTPIQQKAIPLVLQGHDLWATAQTGTGKTAAFAIPIIQHLIKSTNHPKGDKAPIQALILTPTRELAIQIEENIEDYTANCAVRHSVIFGGVKQGRQVAKLQKGVDILVATPGRLLDLIQQGFIKLDHIKYFVLDEADRMLDMGFIHDIKKIIKMLPQKRQSLLFSATMPEHIIQLSRSFLRNPKKISVDPVSSAAETVQQKLYYTNKADKNKLILHILGQENIYQALIFTRTKHGADKIVRLFKKHKITAAAIHGNKSQHQRQKALNQFKDNEIAYLVATDIAARGIDIEKLEHVINFDIPNISETYVHRIGRVGRAGESGIAISISEPEENSYIQDIQKMINQKLEVVKNHPYPQTDRPMNKEEKKAHEKEKKEKKKAFFENRRKKHERRQNRPKSNRKKR